MRSRIAIFEGYSAPFGRPSLGRTSLGRRSYYVPPRRYVSEDTRGGYGPGRKPKRGYKVKRMKDTPAMKRVQSRFTKAAKKCSRQTRNSRKGSYRVCMRRALKSKR